MTEEVWETIPEFTNYQVSNLGRVYSILRDHVMRTSRSFGHVKISLKSDYDDKRYTRSVAQLVGEAFVEPQNDRCTHVMLLDGDLDNVRASNIIWRPRWYAWKYAHQLKVEQPVHYHNLAVINVMTGVVYDSIIECGMTEGLLFHDIWRSTFTGNAIFPNIAKYEIVE